MGDRELLELAAKAIGMTLIPHSYAEGFGFTATSYRGWWNPLTDDGDAMRLAVNLDINLRQKFAMVQAEYPWVDDEFNTRKVLCEPVLDDHCAASRRAIVRAAAEIVEKVGAPLVRAD
jgi:hypothetical protein